jgi:predicted metal-dependent peptidase
MPNVEQKISQAKAKLLLDYPYFGTLASRLEIVINDDIEAFKSEGKTVNVSSDFLAHATSEDLTFVFANGAMHAALAHEMRQNRRSGWLWQMATDFAINDMLVQNGLPLPEGAQYRKRFHGMYAEEIYAELKSDMLRDGELEYEADTSSDVQNDGQSQKEQRREETDSLEQIKEEVLAEKLFAEQALSLLLSHENSGEHYESMERFFTLDAKGKIDWRQELKAALDTHHRDDFRLVPPNKKYLYRGIYIPSTYSERFSLVVAIDSSGSVDEELLSAFLSEVDFLMSQIQNYKIELLVCDDRIRSHETFYSGEALACKPIGGGGTDFRPVFSFVQSELYLCDLILYFTDMEGVFPSEAPPQRVKWVSTSSKEPPFGELILLE